MKTSTQLLYQWLRIMLLIPDWRRIPKVVGPAFWTSWALYTIFYFAHWAQVYGLTLRMIAPYMFLSAVFLMMPARIGTAVFMCYAATDLIWVLTGFRVAAYDIYAAVVIILGYFYNEHLSNKT